jgi:predicted transcriptional regulator
MRKNRNRLKIIAAILTACNSGNCKTRIMRQANLSYKLLEKYLHIVSRLGLVNVDGQKYHLTEKGKEFLEKYNHFHARYVVAQELLVSLDREYKELYMFVSSF